MKTLRRTLYPVSQTPLSRTAIRKLQRRLSTRSTAKISGATYSKYGVINCNLACCIGLWYYRFCCCWWCFFTMFFFGGGCCVNDFPFLDKNLRKKTNTLSHPVFYKEIVVKLEMSICLIMHISFATLNREKIVKQLC